MMTIDSKPLIEWITRASAAITNRIYISVHDNQTASRFKAILPYNLTYLVDTFSSPRSVMLALASSFPQIKEQHIAVFPVDSPFVSPKLVRLMISKSPGYDLVIPMWPDGRIEAIHGIYDRKAASHAVEELWSKHKLDLQSLVRQTHKALFIGTEELAESDPTLLSLLDADTPNEFELLRSLYLRRETA